MWVYKGHRGVDKAFKKTISPGKLMAVMVRSCALTNTLAQFGSKVGSVAPGRMLNIAFPVYTDIKTIHVCPKIQNLVLCSHSSPCINYWHLGWSPGKHIISWSKLEQFQEGKIPEEFWSWTYTFKLFFSIKSQQTPPGSSLSSIF